MECTERILITRVTRNLITRVLTICHVKLTQSTAMEQKRFDLRSLSPALPVVSTRRGQDLGVKFIKTLIFYNLPFALAPLFTQTRERVIKPVDFYYISS